VKEEDEGDSTLRPEWLGSTWVLEELQSLIRLQRIRLCVTLYASFLHKTKYTIWMCTYRNDLAGARLGLASWNFLFLVSTVVWGGWHTYWKSRSCIAIRAYLFSCVTLYMPYLCIIALQRSTAGVTVHSCLACKVANFCIFLV
jgi:hypothetical protein